MRLNVSFLDENGNIVQIEGSGNTINECLKSANEDFKNQPKTEIDIKEIYNKPFRADTNTFGRPREINANSGDIYDDDADQ